MLRASLAGKLRNTTLPKSRALLPVFEAVYNSFQAIDDAPQSPTHEIHVQVQRQNTLSPSGSDPVSAFIIADTGAGFTQANYNSFVTADSLHKQERGGKGVGRFLWLKAFAHADIDSHFLDQKSGELRRRVFHFDLTFDKSQDGDTTPSNQTRPRTTIALVDYLDPYRSECPRDLTIIAQRFVGHFLPLFLAPDGPAFILEDDYAAIDLRVFFREHVEELAILPPR